MNDLTDSHSDHNKPFTPNSPEESNLEQAVFHAANNQDTPEDVREVIKTLWNQYVLRENWFKPLEVELFKSTLDIDDSKPHVLVVSGKQNITPQTLPKAPIIIS